MWNVQRILFPQQKLDKIDEESGKQRKMSKRKDPEANVKELWLTHYSPALTKAEEFIPATRKIFQNTYPGKDGKSVDLMFEEGDGV